MPVQRMHRNVRPEFKKHIRQRGPFVLMERVGGAKKITRFNEYRIE
jgi:hypothetical protein